MDGFTGVLFHVDAFDAHGTCGTVAKFDQHFTFPYDGVVELGNLVALWQIWVEIVFAVKRGFQMDFGVQAKARAHGLFDAKFVDDGQHAGHGSVNKGNV